MLEATELLLDNRIERIAQPLQTSAPDDLTEPRKTQSV